MKKLILISGIIAVMGLVLCVGSANAAFRVDNTGQIVYYSNILAAYSYTFTDTARLTVLFGPEMYLRKYVKNNITGDSDANQVNVGRGDTITFRLYSANNQPNADTAAWHVLMFDTFALFANVAPGVATATTGHSDTMTNAGDSFTYIPGSETVTYEANPESMVIPNSITYYIEGVGWLGWFDAASHTPQGTWYNYDANREAGLAEPKRVQGIKWYWNYVPSENTVDIDGNLISTGLPYIVKVQFSLKKNDN